ncbi:TY4B-J, partial [Symbiodinium sp. CCMP2456]
MIHDNLADSLHYHNERLALPPSYRAVPPPAILQQPPAQHDTGDPESPGHWSVVAENEHENSERNNDMVPGQRMPMETDDVDWRQLMSTLGPTQPAQLALVPNMMTNATGARPYSAGYEHAYLKGLWSSFVKSSENAYGQRQEPIPYDHAYRDLPAT